jgi:Spy/CpxP family protein refolding chaperone
MKKTMTIMAAIALAAIMVTPAAAWNGGMRGGHGYGTYYAEDITTAPGLNLTPEQTARINALRDANLRDTKPLKDKMYSKRGDLKLLWLQTNPDQNKITAAQKEIRALRDQMQDKMTAYRLEVLKVLTPEQQEKMKSFRMGRGGGPGMKGGPGMGGGQGMGMRGNW